MRTTLTLDDFMLSTLKKKAAEKQIPLKTMVHQTLQLGLEAMENTSVLNQKCVTPVCSLIPKAGIDLDKLGQLSDELDDIEKLKKSR